jgi:FAD dependent oxidoreductase TIGR03364
MRSARQRVVIVGGGIVGLAHAWAAAKRGHAVTVVERDAYPLGASVRNFGMIWPIGQPAGELREVAMLSQSLWLELAEKSALWVEKCGSIHVAHAEDEWQVLKEYAVSEAGHGCELLDAKAVLARSPAANPEGLIGGLYSPSECVVNPPAALTHISTWLRDRMGVKFLPGTLVGQVRHGLALTAYGQAIEADRIIVSGGDDCRALFPDLTRESGLVRCKLQMLKTSPQPDGWKLGPHLAGGLTLRHYANFAACPTLPAVKQRVARESPELDRYGIHVMASQNDAGEVILGDSHEYGDAIEPFDKCVIDELILRELRRIIRLPDWTIAARWNGIYLKHPTQPVFQAEPFEKVHVVTGTGGAGMTMSFGIAEMFWQRIDDRPIRI